ncbi:hypothetical protein [Streptomyces sp. NPDC059786]|uniref:hypothetical protein n=1 Tax=Streptomyces sp. NPDC059786 TaxID=3346946 RepID=UPI00366A09D2
MRAVVTQLLDDLRSTTWQALGRDDHTVEERLAGAFEAFHAVTVEVTDRQTFAESLQAAQALAADSMSRLEHDLVTDVAQHLFDASAGAKYQSATLAEHRRRLRVSVRVVTSTGCR